MLRSEGKGAVAPTDGGLQELAADPSIAPHGLSHLGHVSACCLAQRTHSVDTAHALCQECVAGLEVRASGAGLGWVRLPKDLLVRLGTVALGHVVLG